MKRAFLPLAAAVPVLFLCACSQSAPRLDSVSLRLTYRSGGVERLSFFALASDDDGILDLEELHLLHDRSQLYWSLSASDWLRAERTGETWIGSHSIAMPDDAPFPRGSYRAVLVDKGGSRAERSVGFDPPAAAARAFPSLSIAAGRYRIASAYPKNSIVAYDASMAVAKTVVPKASEGPISELGLASTARFIALWAEDDERMVGALTDPAPLRAP